MGTAKLGPDIWHRPTPSKGTITQEESIDLQFKKSNKSVSES